MAHHPHDENNFRLHTPVFDKLNNQLDRRHFLTKTSLGIGALALGSLLGKNWVSGKDIPSAAASDAAIDDVLRALPHFAPKAKRVVYLFMSGGPSQIETFDYKPVLAEHYGQDLPGSVRQGQRLTAMSANQSKFPMVP